MSNKMDKYIVMRKGPFNRNVKQKDFSTPNLRQVVYFYVTNELSPGMNELSLGFI